MNRKIYRQIAKKHGVSIEEVKRDMQSAIAEAYRDPNAAALAVPRKGVAPTPEELMTYIAGRMREKGGGQE